MIDGDDDWEDEIVSLVEVCVVDVEDLVVDDRVAVEDGVVVLEILIFTLSASAVVFPGSYIAK